MVMELDHDLGEGTSASVNAQLNGNAPATHLMELEARAAEWPGAVRSLINTAFEDGDLEEAFSVVMQNTGDISRPNADTIMQVVAVALEPEPCLPKYKKRKDRNKQRAEIDEDDDDDDISHDAYALTSHHASQKAITLLQRWIRQPGPTRLLAAFPRRADSPYAPSRVKCSFVQDDEDQLKPLQVIARRVSLCDDLWELLSKRVSEDESSRSSRVSALDGSQPIGLPEPSWELLKVLVEAWRAESELAVDDAKVALQYSPSLVSQFKPSALGGPPTDTSAAIEIVFQPFKDVHLADLKRTEHVETALRLLDLLAIAASKGAVDKSAFQNSFCESLQVLRASNLQELVTHAAKIDLMSSYLTKYSAPSSTVFPAAPKASTNSSTPPRKPSSSAPSSSKNSLPSSQQNIVYIDSDSDSTDSDIVCLTPIIKKTKPAKPEASPVKARPLARASSQKANGLNSPQSSQQDVKPKITAFLDPLLAKPKEIIDKMARQIPRELLSLSVDAPKLRVPSRMAQSTKATANGRSITQGMINAEIKFATIKLELARVYIAYADSKKATAVQSDWKASKSSPLLSKGICGHRHLFLSDEGDLPRDLEVWERREQAVLNSCSS